MNSNAQTTRPVVFFDGGCPLCRREIAHYQRLDQQDKVRWVDIHAQPDSLHPYGVSWETAMQRIHLLDVHARLDAAGARCVSIRIVGQVSFGEHNHRDHAGLDGQGQVTLEPGFLELLVARRHHEENVDIGSNQLDFCFLASSDTSACGNPASRMPSPRARPRPRPPAAPRPRRGQQPSRRPARKR